MTWLIALILFVAAFCCSMPYYLVPNLFAFDLMGTECPRAERCVVLLPGLFDKVIRNPKKKPGEHRKSKHREHNFPQTYCLMSWRLLFSGATLIAFFEPLIG